MVHARRMIRERVADPATTGQFINQTGNTLGARVRVGSDSFAGSLEFSRQRLTPEGRETDSIRRLAVGLEYKIAKDVWINAAVGGEGGRKNGENKSFVLGGLKLGSSTAPVFSPAP